MHVAQAEVDTRSALRAEIAAYDGLAEAVRELVDATIRTKIGADDVTTLTAQVREVSRQLLTDAHPGSIGHLKRVDEWGGNPANPMDGRRNAIAPPLTILRDTEGKRATSAFNLGAAYEGPPGNIHGGIIAALFDQVMGMVPAFGNTPRMTAYLKVNYRRPCPLMTDLGIEAWLDRVEGRKSFIAARIFDADGNTTAEAEALFIALKPDQLPS